MSNGTEMLVAEDAKVRTVQVDVFAYREGDDILFAQAWRMDGDPARQKGHIEIPKGQGDVPFKFHLHDRSGLNLAFLPNDEGKQEGPFWCSTMDCPTSWGDGNGQIMDISSSNNLLKIVDANSGDPCTLHYALRFTGDELGSGPPYSFDPDIRNGGGGVGGGSG